MTDHVSVLTLLFQHEVAILLIGIKDHHHALYTSQFTSEPSHSDADPISPLRTPTRLITGPSSVLYLHILYHCVPVELAVGVLCVL